MPDISMCTNDRCPIKVGCYRFTAIPGVMLQSYSSWEFKIVNGNHITCDGYWNNDGY